MFQTTPMTAADGLIGGLAPVITLDQLFHGEALFRIVWERHLAAMQLISAPAMDEVAA